MKKSLICSFSFRKRKAHTKRKLWMLNYLIFGVFLLSLSLVNAEGTATDGSIVYRCGTINSSGNYVMNQSINYDGTCLNLTANNILLDFNSYELIGSSLGSDLEYGIYLNNINHTKIINGKIHNFTAGIYAQTTFDLNISGGNYSMNGPRNNNLSFNDGYNIYLNNSLSFSISGIDISEPSHSKNAGSSCPYVYSWNGEYFVKDSEIITSSILPEFESETYSKLSSLINDNGVVRFKISEELAETTYLNSVKLYLVTSPSNSEIYTDNLNKFHTISNLEKPINCYDKIGDNCLSIIQEKDGLRWNGESYSEYGNYSDLNGDFLADSVELYELRNYIDLEFNKSGELGKLFIRGSETKIQDSAWIWFYTQAQKNNQTNATLVQEMLLREALLRVHLWNGTDYEFFSLLEEVTTRTLDANIVRVINFSNISGETIKLRIEGLPGWNTINEVGIDFTPDEPISISQLGLASVSNSSEDFNSLLSIDSNYVQLQNGESILLTYTGNVSKNENPNYFILVSGYYIPELTNTLYSKNYNINSEVLNKLYSEENFVGRYIHFRFLKDRVHNTMYGIYLDNCHYGLIQNIFGFHHDGEWIDSDSGLSADGYHEIGINVYNCSMISICDSYLRDWFYAIRIESSSSSSFRNITFFSNGEPNIYNPSGDIHHGGGISEIYSINNSFENLNFLNNGYGYYSSHIYGGSNNFYRNNYFYKNFLGSYYYLGINNSFDNLSINYDSFFSYQTSGPNSYNFNNTFSNINIKVNSIGGFLGSKFNFASNSFSNVSLELVTPLTIRTLLQNESFQRTYERNQTINFNVSITLVNSTATNNFTYNYSIYPPENSFSEKFGEVISFNFTPSKEGIYNFYLNVTQNGIVENRNFIFVVGNVSSNTLTYYIHGRPPLNGQYIEEFQYGEDAGSIHSSPVNSEQYRTCGGWLEFTLDDIINYMPIIKNISVSWWYSAESNGSRGLERWAQRGGQYDYSAFPQNVTNTTFGNIRYRNDYFSFYDLNITSDYLIRPYFLNLKVITNNPYVKGNLTHQSYVNYTYLYSGPKIIYFGSKDNSSEVRSIRSFSSVFNDDSKKNISLIFRGTGEFGLVLNLTDDNYSIIYDNLSCNSNPNCTVNLNEGGFINLTLVLEGIHNLDIFNFTDSQENETEEESSSDSTGSTKNLNFNVEDAKLSEGYNKNVLETWSLKFDVRDEKHILKISSISDGKVKITLSSEPMTLELGVGEEKKIDFNSDGIYDLHLKVNSISGKVANIYLKEISEKYELPKTETSSENKTDIVTTEIIEKNYSWIWILGILIIAFVLIYLGLRTHKKRKNWGF